MISVPHLILRFLVFIPFVGAPIRRVSEVLVDTEQGILVPVQNLLECGFRLVIVLGVIAGGIWFLNSMLPEKAPLTNAEIQEAFDADEDEFAEVIRPVKADKLMQIVGQVDEDEVESFEQKSLRLKNKITATNKISKTRLPGLQIEGISKELELRSKLALWNLQHRQFDSEELVQLRDLAGLYQSVLLYDDDARSESLMEEAKLAGIVAFVIGCIEEGVPSAESEVNARLANQIDSLKTPILRSSETAMVLERLSKLAREKIAESNQTTKVCDKLDSLLKQSYAASENQIRKELAELNCEQSASAWKTKAADGSSNSFIHKFSELVDRVLSIDPLTDADFVQLLTKLNQISESGWGTQAEALLDKVLVSIETTGVATSETTQAYNKLDHRLSWIGKPFVMDGIESVSKRPVKFARALATFVLMISKENQQDSDLQLRQMIRGINLGPGQGKVELVILFVHDNDKLNGKQDMVRLAKMNPNLNVWQLNVDSPEWRRFWAAGLQFEDIPMVIVLDQFHQVFVVDANRLEIGNVVGRLASLQRMRDLDLIPTE